MDFKVRYSYILDVLCFMNVLSCVDFYTRFYDGIEKNYYDKLSDDSKEAIKVMVEHTNGMLSPFLTLVISSVEDFEKQRVSDMLRNEELLRESFSKHSYFDSKGWSFKKGMFLPVARIIDEVEALGFKEYWNIQRLPIITQKISEIEDYLFESEIHLEIAKMLGKKDCIEEIILFMNSFAYPHGIKICNNSFISDVRYKKETTLRIAIHEMLHPPYNIENITNVIACLADDELIASAFANQNPNAGYTEMSGFIEENVVEAMELYISLRKGLIDNPIKYLDTHDEGSHVLSYVLLDYFKRFPKEDDKLFEEYFTEIIELMPVGKLRDEYDRVRRNGGYHE